LVSNKMLLRLWLNLLYNNQRNEASYLGVLFELKG
jgi:hypothetical protein